MVCPSPRLHRVLQQPVEPIQRNDRYNNRAAHFWGLKFDLSEELRRFPGLDSRNNRRITAQAVQRDRLGNQLDDRIPVKHRFGFQLQRRHFVLSGWLEPGLDVAQGLAAPEA